VRGVRQLPWGGAGAFKLAAACGVVVKIGGEAAALRNPKARRKGSLDVKG